MNDLSTEAMETGILSCLDCGKCTSRCPLSRFENGISPRLIIDEAILSQYNNGSQPSPDICLTCGSCASKCPSDVDFTSFIRKRREAGSGPELADCSGGVVVEMMAKLMTNPLVTPNRLGWVEDGLRTSEKGDYLYFVGCNPLFQVAFEEREKELREIPVAAVRLLNHIDIEPVVLSGERCCGHDQLWAGDRETFEKLAKLNIDMIRQSAAKTIVTTCPECQLVLSREYAELGLDGVEVKSLFEIITEKTDPGAFKEIVQDVIPDGIIAVQDSCRMNYHLGTNGVPREALGLIPDLTIAEFAESGPNASCCGSNFRSCNSISRNIQIGRIKEAQELKARALVTFCPKCLLHISCARDGDDLDMPIMDATHLIAMSLGVVEQDIPAITEEVK